MDNNRLPQLLSKDVTASSAQTGLNNYPTALASLNDNSDKAGLSFPATKVASPSLSSAELLNSNYVASSSSFDAAHSNTSAPDLETRSNNSSNPRVFNLSGPNSKVLLADQSIRAHVDLTPNKSNYNLSSGVNTIVSNANLQNSMNKVSTPYSSSEDVINNYLDYQLACYLASHRSFISESHAPVTSSNPVLADPLHYDSTKSTTRTISTDSSGDVSVNTKVKKSAGGEAFVGSREKTPRSINTAYWSTF